MSLKNKSLFIFLIDLLGLLLNGEMAYQVLFKRLQLTHFKYEYLSQQIFEYWSLALRHLGA